MPNLRTVLCLMPLLVVSCGAVQPTAPAGPDGGPDLATAVSQTCEEFCICMTSTCTGFATARACLDTCAALSEAALSCRNIHCGFAQGATGATKDLHCTHARGEDPLTCP